MEKLYKNKEEWNQLERETNRASYRTVIERFFDDLVLCNNIYEVDSEIFDNVECGSIYDEEDDTYIEIYQYYLTQLSDYDVKQINNLNELYDSNIIVLYSEKLDVYILCVDHYGTSWDYVSTSIPLTDNIEEV